MENPFPILFLDEAFLVYYKFIHGFNLCFTVESRDSMEAFSVLSSKAVRAIGAFFGVQAVIMCAPQNHQQDTDLAVAWQEYPWPVSMIFDPFELVGALDSIPEKTVLILSCESVKVGLSSGHFTPDRVWLVDDSSAGMIPDKLPLRLDSNFVTFSRRKRSFDDVILAESYAFKDRTFTRRLGIWSSRTGLLSIPVPLTWDRRVDLEGAEVVSTGMTNPPFYVLAKDRSRASGLMAEVVESVRQAMNFSVTLVSPDDKSWGVKVFENGTTRWSGMVGQLLSGGADLCGSGFTVGPERREVLEFTFAAVEDLLTLIEPKKPPPTESGGGEGGGGEKLNLSVFFSIFSPPVWTALLAIAVIGGLFLASSKERVKGNNVLGRMSWGAKVVSLLLLQIGREEDFVGAPGRIAFVSISALSLVLFHSYLGCLTARMASGDSPVRLASFEDVLDGGYTVYTAAGGAFHGFFLNANEGSAAKKVGEVALRTLPVQPGILKDLKHLVTTLPKSVIFVPASYYSGDPALVVREDFGGALRTRLAFGAKVGSELIPALKHHMDKARQSGLLSRLRDKWLRGGRPREDEGRIFVAGDEGAAVVLGFDNLVLPALAAAAGAVGGAACLAAEKMAG